MISSSEMNVRRPWWVWRTHPAPSKQMTQRKEYMLGKRKRVAEENVELMLEFPYLWPMAAWRQRWTMRELEQWAETGREDAVYVNGLAQVFQRWLKKTAKTSLQLSPGTTATRGIVGAAEGFGLMSAFEIREIYAQNERRDQRYDFILTPPIYKFCDLTGAFAFDAVGPLTFWVQPQVYEETGEIMQGPPIGEDKRGVAAYGGRGVKFALSNHELQKALDGNRWATTNDPVQQQAAAIVRIALDAFLERGEPDPRFLDPEQVYKMADRKPF